METTLADDEARLAEIAAAFADALSARLGPWLAATAAARAGSAGRTLDRDELDRVHRDAEEVARRSIPGIRSALEADVDSGRGSPLAEVRASAVAMSTVLSDLGVTPAARDDFARDHFPDDLYDFGPASFAEIHEDLNEPALTWGAARAHVHLRRRREDRP